jgi:hypothetical protein
VTGWIVARGDRAGKLGQATVQPPSHRALVGVEVAVARGQGEPVRLTQDGRPENPGRDVEVADEAADHRELLPVLLAEHGEIGAGLVEQLGHDLRHAVEMTGPRGAAQTVGQAGDADLGREAVGVHLLYRRREEEVAARLGEHGGVTRLVAGIGREILGRGELGGVDENCRHHPVRMGAAHIEEREMPRMERAHGRGQGDPLARRPPSRDAPAQIADAADRLHGAQSPAG